MVTALDRSVACALAHKRDVRPATARPNAEGAAPVSHTIWRLARCGAAPALTSYMAWVRRERSPRCQAERKERTGRNQTTGTARYVRWRCAWEEYVRARPHLAIPPFFALPRLWKLRSSCRLVAGVGSEFNLRRQPPLCTTRRLAPGASVP